MDRLPRYCKKRNGSVEHFDKSRIITAIFKAFVEAREGNQIYPNFFRKRKSPTILSMKGFVAIF